MALREIQETPDQEQRFREMCLYFQELLAREGVQVRPFSHPELAVFSRLDDEKKRESLEDLRTALEIFETTRAEGYELKDSPQHLWRALHKFGWVPQGDIFDKIRDGDIVQIYAKNQKLAFCNLSFYEWISHTVEDLYTGHWYTLTRRDERATQKLYEAAVGILNGERRETFVPGVPEHIIEETGEELNRFWIDVAYASPLKKDGQPDAFLVICRCRWPD